jgi:hypothetical protein
MGLDMYLYAKRHYSEYDADSSKRINIILPASGIGHLADSPSLQVTIRVMYWRKANHIHNWFVQNVQDGVDNCEEHYVSLDDLIKLRDVCENVLINPEEHSVLLPTQSGFFFGSQVVDEWYFDDLRYTVQRLDELFSLDKDPYLNFYYQSSW